MLSVSVFEPRFKMNIFSRSLGRLICYSAYIILSVTAVTLVVSGASRLVWSGLLLSLFLINRLIHFGEAEKSITHLKKYPTPKINLALYLTPQSRRILEKSLDRAF